MTNHNLLAFIYDNSPCAHIDIAFEFNCSDKDVTFRTLDLVFADMVDYNVDKGLFSYKGGFWL